MTTETPAIKKQFSNSQTVEIKEKNAVATEPSIRLFDIFLIASVVITWGLTFVAIKETVKSAPPLQAAGVRFFLASLPLMFIALRPSRLRKLSLLDFGKMAVLGLLQTGLMFGIIYTCSQFVPGSITAIIVNTNPFFVALFAHFLIAGDKLTRQKVSGLLLGFGGVVILVMFGSKGGNIDAGFWPLLLIIASLLWATSSVLLKLFALKDMLSTTAWQLFFGSLPLLVLGFSLETNRAIDWNFSFIFWLGYTALIASSFGWWAWYRLLQRYKASRISVVLFLVPVCGVLSSIIILGESASLNLLIGGTLVILGIIVVNGRMPAHKK